ncbi:MAG: IS1634 family transposase [Actinobacteria bacterium]|nr:IS1634 family transposase [Actinomycetota bacterium]
MDLGHLDVDRSQWKSLATAIADRLAGIQSLLQEDPEIAKAAEKALDHYDFLATSRERRDTRKREARYVNVDVATAATSFNRSFGAELLAGEYYRRVGFEKIFSSLGLDARRRSLAKAVILARLISPGSELLSHRWITRISALPEMLEMDVSTVGKDAIYETADLLYAKKHEIEAMANRIWTQKIPYKRRLLLFDITNTYFEGSCKDNHAPRFGHSKEKRSDCRLVALGLVTDEMGVPVHSEIYEGNRSEPSTMSNIIDSLSAVNTIPTPLSIVMDRGIATKENLELLKKRGYPYIVIERSDKRSTYTEQFLNAKEGFTQDGEEGF